MGQRIYLNNDWIFTERFDEKMIGGDFSGIEFSDIRIPHTVKELPFHYFDEKEYQMLSGYTRNIFAEKQWEGKVVRLTFEAAGHDATVYLNGEKVAEHHNGYTAFIADITE